MESVEAEGRSIDDAIEHALQRLGVTRDKVDIEIISNAPRRLLGLGRRRATVRATLRRPLTLGDGTEPSPQRAAPTSGTAASRESPTLRGGTDALAPAVRPDRTSLDRARTVLGEIIRLTGSAGTVEVADDPAEARLIISGDSSGVLIGRRGQTLDALEYVLNRIMAREDESSWRLIVDLQDYRLRRQQMLEALARRAAARARQRGKPVTLDPMSPRDRRIVHLALRHDPTLTTRSAGMGFFRKVIIIPAGGQRPVPPRPAEQP